MILVEAQRDFHMTKIKNLVKMSSHHLYTTPVHLNYGDTTSITNAPVVPPTITTDSSITTTTIKVLIAGKKFRSDHANTVGTLNAVIDTFDETSTASEVPVKTTLTSSTTITTTTSVIVPTSQLPLRKLIIFLYISISTVNLKSVMN